MTRRTVRAAVVLSAAVVLALAAQGPAVAGGTPPLGAGGTVTGGPGGPGPGAGPVGTGVGNGAGATGPSATQVANIFVAVEFLAGTQYDNPCPAKNAAGDPQTGINIRTVTAGGVIVSTTTSCVYAIPTAVFDTVCGVDLAAVYVGPTGNRNATPQTVNYPVRQTAWGAGTKTLPACAAGLTARFDAAANGYGHHSLTVTAHQQRCQWATYPTAPPTVRSCGSVYISTAQSVQVTTWCGGWERGTTDHYPWDLTVCQGVGQTWSCRVPAAQIDGRPLTSKSELFADGRQHLLAWPGVTTVGLGHPSWTAPPVLTAAVGSTPVAPAWEARNAGPDSWTVRWWGPSGYAGLQTWQADAVWTVTGTVQSATVTGWGLSPDGQVTVTTGTQTVTAAGRCRGTAAVRQVRAQNVNGG